MANKFTSNITKNPNAIDPQGQKGFDKADWDKRQAQAHKEAQDNVKATQAKEQGQAQQSKLKQSVSKLSGNAQTQGRSQEKAPPQQDR